jgi:hypothetical protein
MKTNRNLYCEPIGFHGAREECPYCGQIFSSGEYHDDERVPDCAFEMVRRDLNDHLNGWCSLCPDWDNDPIYWAEGMAFII